MTGEHLKEAGQAAAAKRAGREWSDAAVAAAKDYAATQYSMYGDEHLTIDQLRDSGVCHEPPNANAWGALPKRLVSEGILFPTSMTVKAKRPLAHARTVRVWRVNVGAL
ncbi:hypothetical protein [Burkholderia ubonensis]|uniref:hypothetical protein n=1 Tax=Burkholderia ubonensis TaxID=101571 RepID=UPI002AAF713E|nr:hypothetical protein [Burkholderia ubonensis]